MFQQRKKKSTITIFSLPVLFKIENYNPKLIFLTSCILTSLLVEVRSEDKMSWRLTWSIKFEDGSYYDALREPEAMKFP